MLTVGIQLLEEELLQPNGNNGYQTPRIQTDLIQESDLMGQVYHTLTNLPGFLFLLHMFRVRVYLVG